LSCVYIVCCLIVVSVLFVCCLIVVPLPLGENPFAVNNNNKIQETEDTSNPNSLFTVYNLSVEDYRCNDMSEV
jgi:hypothetical protein